MTFFDESQDLRNPSQEAVPTAPTKLPKTPSDHQEVETI